MLCCGAVARCASYDAHLATAPQHIPTRHDMLPQHLVCKYELNCEYCNVTLARNKAPWWWSDKIETCRSVLKCLKVFYVKLYLHSLVDKLKWLLCGFCIRTKNKIIPRKLSQTKMYSGRKKTGSLTSLLYLSTTLISDCSLRGIRTCTQFAFFLMNPQLKSWNEHFHPASTFIAFSSSRWLFCINHIFISVT